MLWKLLWWTAASLKCWCSVQGLEQNSSIRLLCNLAAKNHSCVISREKIYLTSVELIFGFWGLFFTCYWERSVSHCNSVNIFCLAFVLRSLLISHLAVFEEEIFKISLQGKRNLCCSSRCCLVSKGRNRSYAFSGSWWKKHNWDRGGHKGWRKERNSAVLITDFSSNCSLLSFYVAEYYLLIWPGAFKVMAFNVSLSI